MSFWRGHFLSLETYARVVAKVRTPHTPLVGGPMGERILQTYVVQTFVVGSFALYSFLLTEESTLRDLGIILIITEGP